MVISLKLANDEAVWASRGWEFHRTFFTKSVLTTGNDTVALAFLFPGLQSKGDTSKDVATFSIGHSSTMLEDPKPSMNASKPEVGVKDKSPNGTLPAPPSPRTLLAIQAAMLENSSEEELEDDDESQLGLGKPGMGSGADAGGMSPRTLRAVQQALCEEEEEEEVGAALTSTTGRHPVERAHVKELLTSSSDEEDQGPEDPDAKELLVLPLRQLGNRTISQESVLDPQDCVLDKDLCVPQSTSIPCMEKGPAIAVEEKEEEPWPVGTGVSSVQDNSMSSDLQQRGIASLLVAPTELQLTELTPNGKVEPLRELIYPPERKVPTMQLALPLTPEVEDQSPSEESDSDST